MNRSIVALAAAVAVATYLAACDKGIDSQGSPAATDRNELRVVTLAPNLAELMFAADAGDQLVGVSAYTDFPPAAAELPIIGDAFAIDQEQLLILKPDILLAWDEGTPEHLLDRLRDEGYRIEVIRTSGLDDVADALETIGNLTGNSQQARQCRATLPATGGGAQGSVCGHKPCSCFLPDLEQALVHGKRCALY